MTWTTRPDLRGGPRSSDRGPARAGRPGRHIQASTGSGITSPKWVGSGFIRRDGASPACFARAANHPPASPRARTSRAGRRRTARRRVAADHGTATRTTTSHQQRDHADRYDRDGDQRPPAVRQSARLPTLPRPPNSPHRPAPSLPSLPHRRAPQPRMGRKNRGRRGRGMRHRRPARRPPIGLVGEPLGQ